MGSYKKGVLLLSYLTAFYGLIAVLCYFNGFGGLIGGTFFSDLNSVKGIGDDVPLAIASGLVFLWLLFGAFYVVNKYFSSYNVVDYETENVKNLVAATNEDDRFHKIGTNNGPKKANTEMVLYVLGLFIFCGLLFTSIIDASFYIEKYSTYTLWEFRISTILIAILYFLIVYFYHKKSNKLLSVLATMNKYKKSS
ncbi:hypothetical protein [Halalkalibacter urbisdiaboli]|uniref:hypothetical protein n=1 Tax=Halalkalibacter urbisdiaboli TaxID=1960589 RepID=UPI000B440696|nr:hypothetical protein [Halalkalibacter urbisdiaboli]